jgi:hypothetical protein
LGQRDRNQQVSLRLSGIGWEQVGSTVVPIPALLWNYINRGNEAVALAADGLDEARLPGIIAEDVADLADGSVNAMLCVNENLFAPDMLDDLLPGDETAILGHQKDE